MAVNATAVWRVRIEGNDLNGGAFDPAIVDAGTDYTDQDAAQLILTDVTTSAASAVISSATGGFTSAMIGNAVRIASGTNFTVGTYFIVAVGSSNSATLDRNCTTAAGSSGALRVGGAKATVSIPSIHGAVSGNVVMIRGQGSNYPVDIDYGGVYVNSVSTIMYVGYNGRPKLSHNGRCFYLIGVTVKNIVFVQVSSAYTDGALSINSGTPVCQAINCVFDTAGYDSQVANSYLLLNCTVMNSGVQTATTRTSVNLAMGGGVINCHIKDQRGHGVNVTPGHSVGVIGTIIQNCSGNGIIVGANGANPYTGTVITNNTIHACGGHGISTSRNDVLITKNIISGITGAGMYGINATGSVIAMTGYAGLAGNNFHGNTANSNVSLSPLDSTVDPQYVNAPTDLTPQNTALRYLSGVGA